MQEPRGPSDSMERKAQDYSDEPRLPREDSASSIERLAREFSGDLLGVEEPAKRRIEEETSPLRGADKRPLSKPMAGLLP